MYIRSLKHALIATAAMACMASDEPVGLIELDGSLGDAEKPKDIPAGKYKGEIQSVQVATSGKGNQYFAIQFKVPSDELPANVRDDYEDGALLFWNRVIVPRGASDRRAIFNLKKFVEALGLDTNTTTVDPNEWMGCEAELTVVTGKYQGEDRAEIRTVAPAEAKAAPAAKRGAAKGRKAA